jgi:hypothetical protein
MRRNIAIQRNAQGGFQAVDSPLVLLGRLTEAQKNQGFWLSCLLTAKKSAIHIPSCRHCNLLWLCHDSEKHGAREMNCLINKLGK